jgi:hypothetical protein
MLMPTSSTSTMCVDYGCMDIWIMWCALLYVRIMINELFDDSLSDTRFIIIIINNII